MRAQLEEARQDVGEELLGPELELLWVLDLEVLAPGAGQERQVRVEHGGEAVDDLGRQERLLCLVREELEQPQRLVTEVEVRLDGRFVLPQELLLLLPLGGGPRLPRRCVGHCALQVDNLAQVFERVVEQVGRVVHEQVDKAHVAVKVDSEGGTRRGRQRGASSAERVKRTTSTHWLSRLSDSRCVGLIHTSLKSCVM